MRSAPPAPPRGLELHFRRDAAGRPVGSTVEAGRVQHIRFIRR